MCKKDKPIIEFGFKYKKMNIRQFHCKECSRKEVMNHYYANREYYLNKARKRNLLTQNIHKSYILEYLKLHPCVDCGEKDPIVLEFDHIKDKYKEISKLIRDSSFQRLKDEVVKCEIRCANCHRRKTFRELNVKIYKSPS